MLSPLWAARVILVCLWLPGSDLLSAQNSGPRPGGAYPTRPIRIITSEAGGGTDFAARMVAQGIAGPLSQPVIVDNRGSGTISGGIASKATPDGYTLLVTTNALWVLPFIQTVSFDPVKDFLPIATAAFSPTILVVHPSLPIKTVKELIARAKAKPGELNYASAGTGSSPHLAAELFKAMAEVNIVRIPYKGSGPALNDLIGGQVQIMFGTAGSVTTIIAAGKLRGLAVTSAQPSALFPGLPTVAESGVPGYRSETTYGVFAPAGTPASIVNRLNREVVLAVARQEIRDKFQNAGVEVAGSTPAQFAALIKTDIARMGKVIKDTGIRAD